MRLIISKNIARKHFPTVLLLLPSLYLDRVLCPCFSDLHNSFRILVQSPWATSVFQFFCLLICGIFSHWRIKHICIFVHCLRCMCLSSSPYFYDLLLCSAVVFDIYLLLKLIGINMYQNNSNVLKKQHL